jgi:PHP family Zn ribbon phosphoesterase
LNGDDVGQRRYDGVSILKGVSFRVEVLMDAEVLHPRCRTERVRRYYRFPLTLD